MSIVGIVAEYNPFHNGHRYQLQEVRRRLGDVPIITAMSGDFTQRGEAAIADKWTRARWAVDGGVSLLLELPTVFALRSAQSFAAGGVRLLAAAGADTIAFGAETDNLPLLQNIAALSSDETITGLLKSRLKTGRSYASAISQLLQEKIGSSYPAENIEEVIKSPNNILAIQYLRAINKYAPKLQPLLIHREGAGYHQEEVGHLNSEAVAGASAIRKALQSAGAFDPEIMQAMPSPVADELLRLKERDALADTALLFPAILGRLLPMTAGELSRLHGVGEGLENLLWAALRDTGVNSLSSLIGSLKSKRYPYTRLSRLMIAALLNITEEAVSRFDESGPLYFRPLAFDEKGRQILAVLRDKYRDEGNNENALPVITSVKDFLPRLAQRGAAEAKPLTLLQEMLALDMLAAEIWSLSLPAAGRSNIVPETKAKLHYRQSPFNKSIL
ncbi:MAG: nucleotidyltransferase family protein [Selenomonadaceae bacterium]|nr:nucleotidyltransferase family protein [Selenomonadaceae bacterium]